MVLFRVAQIRSKILDRLVCDSAVLALRYLLHCPAAVRLVGVRRLWITIRARIIRPVEDMAQGRFRCQVRGMLANFKHAYRGDTGESGVVWM